MQDDRVFWWHRTPLPAWEHALARIAPRRDRLSHLVIAWYAGTPTLWRNVETNHQFVNGQRWVVFEAVPARYVPVLEQRVWELPYRSADVGLSRRYLTEFGSVLTPFWTIQGDDRGHPYRLSQHEADTRRAQGLPDKVPIVGELPYAEPSERTWRLVMDRSLLYAAHRHAHFWDRHIARREQLEREQRRAIIGLADETSEITKDASDIIWDDQTLAIRRDRDDPKARFADASETDAYYLETGLVDQAPGI